MVDPDKLYRARPANDDPFADPWTMKEMQDAIFVDEESFTPSDFPARTIRYHCFNSACLANNVIIAMVLRDGQVCPPEMFCPACRHPLGKPMGYRTTVPLFPVED